MRKYVEEVKGLYNELREEYPDFNGVNIALTILNLAISARNADAMNANVSGNLVITENGMEFKRNN